MKRWEEKILFVSQDQAKAYFLEVPFQRGYHGIGGTM